jgi:2-dehydro-3-deoxygalactonokinase
MTDRTALIGIDWGTSSFRAYRIGASGAVLERISSACGIRSVSTGAFSDVLADQVGAWIDKSDPAPVLMSGMIGSRQGWQEAPYCPMPVSLDAVAGNLIAIDQPASSSLSIVPGVALDDEAMPDVMRGEETQIIGALRQYERTDGTFVLPGTHSKWVYVADGQIRHFATYMTGEIFAALRGHTILGSLMSERNGLHAEGFQKGLDDGRQTGSPGALLHRLFGARTHALFGRIDDDAIADYLSGLLIGAEFADAAGKPDKVLSILGASDLAERYMLAAERFGLQAERIDPDCTASGLYAIACRAGLINSRQDNV